MLAIKLAESSPPTAPNLSSGGDLKYSVMESKSHHIVLILGTKSKIFHRSDSSTVSTKQGVPLQSRPKVS